jgi:hypothetical protein
MHTWTSNPIHLTAASVDVKADAEGVTLGAQSDGSLLIDLHMTPEKAMEIADALTQGAAKCLAARGEA